MEIKDEQLTNLVRKIVQEVNNHHDRLYNIDQVAEKLNVNPMTVWRKTKPNKHGQIELTPVRVGKNIKFSGWEIQRYLATCSPVPRSI